MTDHNAMDAKSSNPYVATEVVVDQPLRYGGTRSGEDHRISLRDTAPGKWPLVKHVLTAAFLLLVVGAGVSSGFDEPWWLIIAAFLLSATWWMKFVRWVSPAYRKRAKHAKQATQNPREVVGFIDNAGIVETDGISVSRINWEFLAHATIFPEQIVVQTLGQHRRVIPLRFFFSVEEARAAADLVRNNVWVTVNKMPNEHVLSKLVLANPLRPQPMDATLFNTYTDENWPYSGTANSEQQDLVELDLLAGRSTFKIALISSLTLPLILLWWFLPLVVSLVALGAFRYVASGRQSIFAFEFEAFVFGVPTVFIAAFLLFRTMRAVFGVHQIGQQKLSCIMRPQGAHISHDSIKSWFGWESVSELLLEDNSAGFVFADTGIEARYPRGCFNSNDDFERFKSALKKHSGARSENETPT